MVGWLALFGAVVYLDTTAAFQFMLCQPIIACPIFGMIVGRPEIGLFYGVTFQLLWLKALPVGAARFPEGNLGALVATALVATVPLGSTAQTAWLVLAYGAIAGLLVAGCGRYLTPFVRRLLKYFSDAYQNALVDGKDGSGRAIFLAALLLNAVAGALFTLVLYFVFSGGMSWFLGVSSQTSFPAELAARTDYLWEGLFPALIGAGTGVVAARFARRRMLGWIVAGFCIAMGVLLWL